jgi:hypothetical protein
MELDLQSLCIWAPCVQLYLLAETRVSDPDPYWIRIQSGQQIRIRIRNLDPDTGGQKVPRT